jgi:hypothetical protein
VAAGKSETMRFMISIRCSYPSLIDRQFPAVAFFLNVPFLTNAHPSC